MDPNLKHEDLLIKLRAKLNEGKVKLWEPPFNIPGEAIADSLQELAKKYASELSSETDTVLQALHELQLHSIDRSKANTEFKETGCATLRVKATIPGEKAHTIKIQKKLDVNGSDLIQDVADDVKVTSSRVKLIFNGKVLKASETLEAQGVKNGIQIMALIMAETPEDAKKEDTMYMEMKTTREDALLLSEHVEDYVDDEEEYMKLEDQSGKTVELPATEKRSLLVGLALHERGKAAAREKDYSLALILLLEADRQLSECSSSILNTVDNWGVLQLDIAWCYLCLQNLSSASDAAARLARAEESFKNSYGEDFQRLIALKGTAANERVLIMRLYLLQGIVAYHQNKRAEAKELLEKAENEISFLRVDESSVQELTELGWTRGEARAGLRAAGGGTRRAHTHLTHTRALRAAARTLHRRDRQRKLLGLCLDGSAVEQQLVDTLIGMGYSRKLATVALRNSNNQIAEAVRLIQDHPEMLEDSDLSSEETSHESDDSAVEPEDKLVDELTAMGYDPEEAKTALRMSRNKLNEAVDILVACGGHIVNDVDPSNPSTSSGVPKKRQKNHKRDKKKKLREEALNRLSKSIKMQEDNHLDTSLEEEEAFLAQYKTLI